MGMYDSFSKRQRRQREGTSDVYEYDELPQPLRVQLVHVLRDGIGVDDSGWTKAAEVYEHIEKTLAREYGLFSLGDAARSAKGRVEKFILSEGDHEKVLDVVELAMKVMITYIAGNQEYDWNTKDRSAPSKVLEELNARFREHAIGYRFEGGELLRVDSEVIHQEATKPALVLLADAAFEGANQEFLEAHEHYRHGRNKECLVSCLKAFESTIRVICAQRCWHVDASANAAKLIAALFENKLLPTHMESQLGALRSLLESGIPTVRNKLGGHGQGVEVKHVPEFVARYGLNLTASSIVFLLESHKYAPPESAQ